jgi:hypothetical protein
MYLRQRKKLVSALADLEMNGQSERAHPEPFPPSQTTETPASQAPASEVTPYEPATAALPAPVGSSAPHTKSVYIPAA